MINITGVPTWILDSLYFLKKEVCDFYTNQKFPSYNIVHII